jgi:hypothetical protein
MGREAILDRARKMSRELTKWAEMEGHMPENVDEIVLVPQFVGEADYLSMKPSEFFSVQRLLEAGLPQTLATRGNNCLRNVEDNCGYEMTVSILTSKYKDVSDFLKVKNLGKRTATGIGRAMIAAGLEIKDRGGLLK